jgi:glucose/arabinose dehydrogenase
VVLLDNVRAPAAGASASLRFGPDGKLYAAFDDGGDPASAGDLASPNGKVLRLNADGSTPDDQAGATPLYSSVYHSPRGLDWQPSTGLLWVADASTLSVVDAETGRPASAGPAEARGRTRGVTTRTLALPRGLDPSAMAFYRGPVAAFRDNLLMASAAGQQLLRARFDPRDASVIASTERLLDHRIGAIRAVASAPDGAIYIATDHAIGRLVPVR